MRTAFSLVCLTAFAASSLSILPGCGSGGITGGTPAGPTGHYEGDGHDHSGDISQGHPTEGPHGGHLIELGNEEYHAELTHEEATNTVTIYLLDGPGKSPVAVPLDQITLQLFRDGQFVDYALTAEPGQTESASQFGIVDASLCEALAREAGLKGRLHVTINGESFTGTIEHTAHASHEDEMHETGEAGHDGHQH